MSNGRRQLKPTEVMALPSLLTPAVLIGIALYFIDDRLGLHDAITTVIFVTANFAAYKLVPERWLYGFGLTVTTLVLFIMMIVGIKDWIWAFFWTGLYLFVGQFSLRAVLGASENEDSVANDEDSERAPPEYKRHKNVGFCQGWNVSTISKSSHHLYRCGNCGTSGCTDRNCDRVNFNGTRCLSCGVHANFRS